VTAAILLVGDEPILLQTRADLLREWQVSTANAERAGDAVRLRAFDLLVFCQTIPDATAQQLIDAARAINPDVQALAIAQAGQARNLNAGLFEVALGDPDRLRRAVALLLQQPDPGDGQG
jgi:CheY-like chemotaxis protein